MPMVEQKTSTGTSLKKKVLIGSFWLYALQGFSIVLLLLLTVILARLLTPAHFGIVGVFLILSSGLESFTNTGFNKALIQRKEVKKVYLDTAWTVSIVRGIILFTAIFFGGSLVVELLNTPKALPVIRVLGLTMLIQGFNNTGIIYFSKNLDFFKQFLLKGIPLLANFIVSVPLAFILRNEWAIAYGMLASSIVLLLFSFVLHPYRPRLRFNFEEFKLLFH